MPSETCVKCNTTYGTAEKKVVLSGKITMHTRCYETYLAELREINREKKRSYHI